MIAIEDGVFAFKVLLLNLSYKAVTQRLCRRAMDHANVSSILLPLFWACQIQGMGMNEQLQQK